MAFLRVSLGLLIAAGVATSTFAQTIRNYTVNQRTAAITLDGVASPGEWDAASAAAGDWRELRQPFTDVDQDNNRFRVLYDSSALYILYQTDYNFGWLDSFGGNPSISFGEENLNIYIDPNKDGDLNVGSDGLPVLPGNSSNGGIADGYQIAINQYLGNYVSTDADRQGVGFFTEGHVNTPFGDQANWNQGGSQVLGDALDGIVVAQVNTNPAGGTMELRIPFADLDADAMIAAPPVNADYNGDGSQNAADYTVWRDNLGSMANLAADGNLNGVVDQADYDLWASGYGRGPGAMIPTGLNATSGVQAGDVWGFNMSQISRDSANNFLPIWNWHDNNSFAPWPHGTLTFAGAPSAVPEPATGLILLLGLAACPRRRA
ncbi:MAG: hypothetical protein ACRCT8_12910 [Lacipirellulaceae bacterium]